MKVDRRSFLSFVIGGAVGTQLSPLPWKLTDDFSIWSQNWPWTPVPPEGEYTHVNSACTLCPGGCGITVRKVGERAVKIEGMKDHPVNRGGLCILGLAGLQLLYGPIRIASPLKRVGNRGEGKWERIGWDEAIQTVSTQLADIRKKGQPQRLGCISGAEHGTMSRLLERFLAAYGSPNFMSMSSVYDAYELALYRTQGIKARAGFDFYDTDFVLSLGSGILEGWGSPVYMFLAHSRWTETGTKMVQIEPRLSNTAAKADQWAAINPGTEADLVLGLCHVICSESLYDKSFVENRSDGFEEWKKAVLANFSPDAVQQKTGIDKAVIVALARRFARAKQPIAICGKGKGRGNAESMREVMAVHALNALAGRIGKPGGVQPVIESPIEWPAPEMDSIAAQGMQTPRIDGAGGQAYSDSRNLVTNFFKKAEKSGTPLDALFIAEANPCHSVMNTEMVKKVIGDIPLVVNFTSYMDETAAYSDLILPNHVYLERYDDVSWAAGFPKPIVTLARPVVSPQFNTKHLGDTIIGLAGKMGGSIAQAFPWENYETCLRQTLSDKWDVLNEQGFWMGDQSAPAIETASGKFRFSSSYVTDYPPASLPGDAGAYPLILFPYDTMRLTTGYIGDPPFLIKTVPSDILKENASYVQINPKTAASYGLSKGDTVTVTTPAGSERLKVYLSEEIMPGLIGMARGLGHTAYDKFLGGKGSNVNALLTPLEDPASGLNVAWGIRAKLSKA